MTFLAAFSRRSPDPDVAYATPRVVDAAGLVPDDHPGTNTDGDSARDRLARVAAMVRATHRAGVPF